MTAGIKLSQDEFINRAKSLHNDTYCYDKVVYVNSLTKVIIICHEHGEFLVYPKYHLQEDSLQGCPQCMMKKKKNNLKTHKEDFIKKAQAVHGDRYNYSRVVYINNNTKVEIGRDDGTWFWQIPKNHLKGHVDKRTSIQNMKQTNLERYGVETPLQNIEIMEKLKTTNMERYGVESTLQHEETKEKIKATNLEKYGVGNNSQSHISPEALEILHNEDYLKQIISEYGTHKTAQILGVNHATVCRHGIDHTGNDGFRSNGERILAEWLSSLGLNFCTDRKILNGKEIDFYFKDEKFGIEFDGLISHAEISGNKDRNYHKWKTDECQKQGIRLIHIFEDEFYKRRTIVQDIIKTLLGIQVKGVGARNLTIKEISNEIARNFFNEFHIQKSSRFSICIGGYYNNTLVGAMGFGSPTRQSSYMYELKRYCSDGKIYPGMGSRLFKYFVENYNPSNIVSFCDKRYFTGSSYSEIGLIYDGEVAPDYTYTCDYHTRHHKSKFRLENIQKLISEDVNLKSEWSWMQELGYDRLWDCGKSRFVWNNPNLNT